jgi:hypothetical protein
LTRLDILRRRHITVPAQAKDDPMTAITTAAVPTAKGSRYLQQLCKHWAHSLPVEFTPEHGEIRFPAEGRAGSFPGEALVSFDAGPEALEVTIEASVPEQRDAMKGVVARHLDRFAFREAPLPFAWRDAA